MKAFKRIAPILVWLVVSMPGAALAAFSAADFSGTWHFFVFFDHPTTDDPGWRRGTVTFNSSGTVTAGSLTDNENTTVSITGGSLSVNNLGFLSGTVLSSNGVTSTFTGGKMDKGKNFISFVGTDNQGYRFKGSAIKAGGTFSTGDVGGTWHYHTFLGELGQDTASWSRGTIITNSSGTITGGSFTNDLNIIVNVTGGSISINSSGVFTGTINFSNGIVATLSQGKLDAGKTTAAFVGVDTDGFVFAGQGIKAGGTFSTADLAGRWQFNTFWDDPLANDAGMEHGTVIVNSSGVVTGGAVFFDTDTSPSSVSGGSFAIDGAGVFYGDIQFFGGAFVETISQAKMSGSKTVASYVGIDSDEFVFQGTALKIGGGVIDFDNDGQTEVAVYQTGTGNWFYERSLLGFGQHLNFGGANFLPVPGDYDGDGETDEAVYDTTNGNWFIAQSTAGFRIHPSFGGAGFIPVPGDYDADGRMDVAVYQTSTGHWFIVRSSLGFTNHLAFGGSGYVPVPGDYDGDGKTDTAVYQSSTGNWFIAQSTAGFRVHPSFGGSGFLPVPGDYDGDGKMDVGVYQTGTGYWFWVGSTDGFSQHLNFGGSGFMPVAGDYDGDGHTDRAVYQTATGHWFIAQSTEGIRINPSFGGTGFVPVLPQVTILRALGLL